MKRSNFTAVVVHTFSPRFFFAVFTPCSFPACVCMIFYLVFGDVTVGEAVGEKDQTWSTPFTAVVHGCIDYSLLLQSSLYVHMYHIRRYA